MGIDYDALFGVNTAESGSEGAQEAEPADLPETEEGAEGENEQEPADPADEMTDAAENAAGDGDGTGSAAAQPPEERSKYAAARRKAEAERDAEIAKVRRQSAEEMSELIRESGLINPYTGNPIASLDELKAYRQMHAERKREELKDRNGWGDDEYDSFVSELPEVKQAREVTAKARAERAQANVARQLAEITKLDPTVKTMEDLTGHEKFSEIYQLVKRGYAMQDAFRIATEQTRMERAIAAAKQETVNRARGKDHLTPTQSRGQGGVDVPADVKAEYKLFNPDMTDKEIEAHWRKHVGK